MIDLILIGIGLGSLGYLICEGVVVMVVVDLILIF